MSDDAEKKRSGAKDRMAPAPCCLDRSSFSLILALDHIWRSVSALVSSSSLRTSSLSVSRLLTGSRLQQLPRAPRHRAPAQRHRGAYLSVVRCPVSGPYNTCPTSCPSA